MPDARLLEDLWTKVADHPDEDAKELVRHLRKYRLKLLSKCEKEPTSLLTWLYENQGVRRFDAANRLFLVLTDRANFFASWRLKRAKPLLDKKIGEYLDSVSKKPGRKIDFVWESETYTATADAIFIIHPDEEDAPADESAPKK